MPSRLKLNCSAPRYKWNDCVLRSPFDGEIANRMIDPGAFVRPGVSIVSIVDRATIRVVADAPEIDFGFLSPGTQVKLRVLATNQETSRRRSPAARPRPIR